MHNMNDFIKDCTKLNIIECPMNFDCSITTFHHNSKYLIETGYLCIEIRQNNIGDKIR